MGLVRSRWLGCGRVDPAGTTAEVEAMVGPPTTGPARHASRHPGAPRASRAVTARCPCSGLLKSLIPATDPPAVVPTSTQPLAPHYAAHRVSGPARDREPVPGLGRSTCG